MRYVSSAPESHGLNVTLKDLSEEIYLHLHYTTDRATGIIGRSSAIENKTKSTVTVQQAAAATYVRNLYGIVRELRQKHPSVAIESCPGDGGRVDLGILSLSDEVWPSDNTDPFDRLRIQDGLPTPTRPG